MVKFCQQEITSYLKDDGADESPLQINQDGLTVILVIGVNGA